MFFLHTLCYLLLVRSFLSGFASIVQQATDQPIGVCSKVGVQQEACGISSFLKVRWAERKVNRNPKRIPNKTSVRSGFNKICLTKIMSSSPTEWNFKKMMCEFDKKKQISTLKVQPIFASKKVEVTVTWDGCGKQKIDASEWPPKN